MKKKAITNRLLSLALCFCMVLGMLSGISPLRANAAGTEGRITIELIDSYGDGWNGNAIEIYANDALLDTATIDSGSNGTWSVAWDNHLTYTFKWVSGEYADETSFVIYWGTEEKLNARGDSYSTGDTLLTVEPLCSEPEFENGICIHCGIACGHSFTDSVCTICGLACGTDRAHDWDKGICTFCGVGCKHGNWSDYICNICGYACGSDELHSFVDCVCTICGFACGTHKPHNWQNGVCTVCSLHCAHASVTEGVCETCSGTCGTTFAHSFNTDDQCTVCGFVCFHTWESGSCTVCGRNCAHESYENGFCTICEDYQAAVDADGDGYYDIANAGNLYWFAREVNGGNRTIYGELTADIVVNEGVLNADGTLKGDGSTLRVWTPIGTKKALSFKGKFNGNDHSISGLYYSGDSEYMGLFGCVRDGRIENVGVVDSYFSVTGSLSEVGAIAGYLYNASNSEIINCYNTGTVFGKYTTGGVVGLGQGGIVTGCYNTGWVSGHGQTGGVISNAENTMLSNCYNTGRVQSSSMSHAGGVAGRYSNRDKSVVLSHCYNTGDVVNTNSYGGAGGVVGTCVNHIEDCYSTGSVTAGRNAGGVAALLNADGLTMTNCYYSSDVFTGGASGDPEDTLINCAGLPMEKFLSGEVCWLLNGSSSEGVWKQTLVDDTLPGFSGETVYQVSGTYCTGEEATVYSNTNASAGAVHKDETNDHLCDGCGETASECRDWNRDHLCDVCSQVFSQHSGGTATCSAKAICTVCGQAYGETDPANHDSGVAFDSNGFCVNGCFEPAADTDSDGYYEIGNAGQLYWFAQLVNLEGKLTAKAVLTADIDLGNRIWYPIGLYNDPAVPDGEALVVQYSGIIDGKGHTVSNFKAIGYGSQGLVGYSARDAIVRNLGVINAEVSGWNAGAVMAYMGTVENCYAMDCSITGSTSGSTAVYVGAVSGTQQSVVRNCFAYNCTLTEGADNQASIGAVGGNSVSNSYYGSIEVSNGTLRSKEGEIEGTQAQFASGEIAYLLGEGWGQTIGEQAHPVPGGEKVYYSYLSCDESVMDMGYSNIESRPDHSPEEDDGDCTTAVYCSVCGKTMKEAGHTEENIPGKAPTCGETGLTEGVKCAVCGEILTAQEEIPATGEHVDDDKDDRCDVCNGLMTLPSLCLKSISLEGNIAINYYMFLPETVLADETAYMQFTMMDGETVKVPVSEATEKQVNGQTYYVFTCAMDAAEMSDDVVCSFFYEGGSTEPFAYSVQTYAKSVLALHPGERLETLLKAMLHYGAASQLFFKHRTDDLANAGFEAPDYSSVTITGFDKTENQGTQLAVFAYATLLLESETTLRFCFRLDSSVAESFKVSYKGQELEVKQRDDLYYVDVEGILAKDLDETVTITIDDGTQTAEVSYNPMTYCQIARNNTDDQTLKNLVAALYLYNQAANNYFA